MMQFSRMVRKPLKVLKLLTKPGYRHGLIHGVGAAVEHEDMLKALGPVGTLVDVGANVGQFALLFRAANPASGIIAFEPLEEPARKFDEVFRDDERTSLRREAVGPVEGQKTIHVSRRMDSSSLLEISPLQSQYFPGTDEIGTQTVQVRPLSACLQNEEIEGDCLLKIDVQGGELDVLKSGGEILDRVRWIYVELSFQRLYVDQPLAHEVMRYLDQKAFQMTAVYNLSYGPDGECVQADFLFDRYGV